MKTEIDAAKEIAEFYARSIATRGRQFSVEFKHPATGEIIQNQVSIPVALLNKLLSEVNQNSNM